MEKYFVISNNLHYMTFNNPVIGSWLNVVFHLYIISNNPVIGSWLDIVFHSYMISCNLVKKLLARYCISFLSDC